MTQEANMDLERRDRQVLNWADTLDVAERPAFGEFDITKAMRELVEENTRLRERNAEHEERFAAESARSSIYKEDFDRLRASRSGEFVSKGDAINILDNVLANGHGGGNWRRLLISAKARLEEAAYAPASPVGEEPDWKALLTEANGLLRSAHSIAFRGGDQTNWKAWRAQLEDVLGKQHRAMYPENYPKSVPSEVKATPPVPADVVERAARLLCETDGKNPDGFPCVGGQPQGPHNWCEYAHFAGALYAANLLRQSAPVEARTRAYPDAGLGEPKMKYEDTFSATEVVKEMFSGSFASPLPAGAAGMRERCADSDLVKALEECAEAKMPGEARRIAREALTRHRQGEK